MSNTSAATGATGAAAGGIGLRSERGPVLAAVMVATAVVAVDASVLATAVPTVVRDIGGFASYPWLFSIFLLCQAATVPVYSKIADSIGRKPVMIAGIGIFLVGSILCGIAWSMPALIVFRAIQGLGAGAIQPLSLTILGDIYSPAERARVQGYIAAVWGVSSVTGPMVGGVFAQIGWWRGLFWINLPVCLFAVWLFARNFTESAQRQRHKIDYAGGTTLTIAVAALILGLLEGGQAWPWWSVPSVLVFAIGFGLLPVVAAIERRAAEPVLPSWVLTRPLLRSANLMSIGIGAILVGLTSFVPIFLEGSLGVEPLTAGLTLGGLLLGWPISSTICGRLYLRFGFKPVVIAGGVIASCGLIAVVFTAGTPIPWLIAFELFFVGFGMGWMNPPLVVSAQASVPWSQRAVVTGAFMFARAVGSAVGVAAFGAITNAIYAGYARGVDDPAAVLDASGWVFRMIATVAVLALVVSMTMPATRPETDGPSPKAEPA